jgi:hypothetical protein
MLGTIPGPLMEPGEDKAVGSVVERRLLGFRPVGIPLCRVGRHDIGIVPDCHSVFGVPGCRTCRVIEAAKLDVLAVRKHELVVENCILVDDPYRNPGIDQSADGMLALARATVAAAFHEIVPVVDNDRYLHAPLVRSEQSGNHRSRSEGVGGDTKRLSGRIDHLQDDFLCTLFGREAHFDLLASRRRNRPTASERTDDLLRAED